MTKKSMGRRTDEKEKQRLSAEQIKAKVAQGMHKGLIARDQKTKQDQTEIKGRAQTHRVPRLKKKTFFEYSRGRNNNTIMVKTAG